MFFGDIRLGETHDWKFTSIDSTGKPATLTSVSTIVAYPNNSTTELTAGITLSTDFDSRTGLHNVRVVASTGNGYATATNYDLVFSHGTCDGIAMNGYKVGAFSIENRSALMSTTSSNKTVAVTATGYISPNWGDVGNPTTALNLSATSIGFLAAAGTGSIVAGSFANNAIAAAAIASNAITSAKIATDAIGAAQLAADAGAEIASAVWQDTTAGDFTTSASVGKSVMNGVALGTGLTVAAVSGAVGSVTGAVGSVTGAVGSVTGAVGSVTGAVGSVTGNVGGNVNGTVGSVVGAVGSVTGNVGGNVSGTVGSVVGAVGSVAANGIAAASIASGALTNAKFAAGAVDAAALATDAGQEIADRLVARNVGGGSDTGRTIKEAIATLRNKMDISGGTLTVYDTDDTTVLFTATITTTAGNPISTVDPA